MRECKVKRKGREVKKREEKSKHRGKKYEGEKVKSLQSFLVQPRMLNSGDMKDWHT